MVSQSPTSIVCPATIGRDSERARLHAFLESRQKRVALLYGEAGIGKSRLVAETKLDAIAQGFLVLQSMMDLGSLWAGHDYQQTKMWFRQALTLAQTLNDSILHARSLNRIGNWHVNVEQPREALDYHKKALDIFQDVRDSHGTAETLDLLGMVSYLGGDLIGGTSYYKRAITLFTDLGDQQ